jgi:hypothetical protein
MAALVEGQQYGLSSNFSPHDQKTVVQVKLTDSALKAIDEYLKRERVKTTREIPFPVAAVSCQFDNKQYKYTIIFCDSLLFVSLSDEDKNEITH